MRAESRLASRLAAMLVAALAVNASADSLPRRPLAPSDVHWPARVDPPVDPRWISERSTGAAGEYVQDFAEALRSHPVVAARYASADALPMPPRGVLLRVLVGADGRTMGFRVFDSSGDADYDRLVIEGLYQDRPIVVPPPALLAGQPTLTLIGMFMLGFSQREDRTGPIDALPLMVLADDSSQARRTAFRAAVSDATKRDMLAKVPAPDRVRDLVLEYVADDRGIAAIEFAQGSGDPAFDQRVVACARAAIAALAPPGHVSPGRWRVRYHFEAATTAASSPR